MKKVWKEKLVNNRRMMLCQNSDPRHSKWPQWGPDSGVCTQWVEVGHNTDAVICHQCTSRSLQF